MEPFEVLFNTTGTKTGDFPFPLTTNAGEGKYAAEVPLGTEDGVKVVKLHSIGYAGALQFYNWQRINLPGGRKYAVTLDTRQLVSAPCSSKGKTSMSGGWK